MSTVLDAATPEQSEQVASAAPVRTHAPIPMSRLVSVELRKSLDTRSGFWLLMSVGILALIATVSVIIWAPDSALTFETFSSAIGIPMAVILPMIAILSVTSEWSQRTGLTTFTLVPDRGRVIGAKAIGALVIGVVSMFVALGVGALGNIVGTAIAGVETTWGVSVPEFSMIILANVIGMTIGFMLGVVMRSSAAAIVGYFVYSFVMPGLLELLAATQGWFADIRAWVDLNYSTTVLFETVPTAEQWANLATAGALWLLLPLSIGLTMVLRSEVK